MESDWDINANAIYRSPCEEFSMDDLDDSDDSDVDHIMRKVGKKWSGTITTEKKSKMKRLDENSTWVDSIVTGTLKSLKFSRGKFCRLD